jgi:hypothetical protein
MAEQALKASVGGWRRLVERSKEGKARRSEPEGVYAVWYSTEGERGERRHPQLIAASQGKRPRCSAALATFEIPSASAAVRIETWLALANWVTWVKAFSRMR